jgi:hypothetical protein
LLRVIPNMLSFGCEVAKAKFAQRDNRKSHGLLSWLLRQLHTFRATSDNGRLLPFSWRVRRSEFSDSQTSNPLSGGLGSQINQLDVKHAGYDENQPRLNEERLGCSLSAVAKLFAVPPQVRNPVALAAALRESQVRDWKVGLRQPVGLSMVHVCRRTFKTASSEADSILLQMRQYPVFTGYCLRQPGPFDLTPITLNLNLSI